MKLTYGVMPVGYCALRGLKTDAGVSIVDVAEDVAESVAMMNALEKFGVLKRAQV